MEDEKLLNECIKYFKSSPGFKRLFEGIREKYRSLGAIGGTVVLKNPAPIEREAVSGLLKRDCYSSKSISAKVESIIKALDGTRFQGVDFEKVLKGYWGGDLISKKDERDAYEDEKDNFFSGLLKLFEGTTGFNWLSYVLESHENAYKTINQRYDKDMGKLKTDLIYAMDGLNHLSFSRKDTVRLAIFSSNISKNPHCFDMDKDCGKLLLYGIAYVLNLPVPQNAEERAEMLYSAGIIIDELSNYTMCSNLLAYKDGRYHSGWQGFFEKGEPLQVSLINLAGIDTIVCPERRVYVFENPTVFSEVLMNTSNLKPSLVCTYGQIKLASLILLDKLIDSVDSIYYSGDFDPEGIMIADKLKQRYREKLVLWHYDLESFNIIKSMERIHPSRLKKLEKVKDKELFSLAKALMQEGYSGYQELLVDRYIEDIVKWGK